MPWFAWFLLGAVLGGSIGCLVAALAYAAGYEAETAKLQAKER